MSKKSTTINTIEENNINEVDVVLNTFKNVSTKIRYLSSLNLTTSQIAKKLDIRYQWVRNVLNTPVTNTKEKF